MANGIYYGEKPIGLRGKGTYRVKNDFEKIMTLVKLGKKIEWSSNGRWCVIGDKTFNLSKEVFEKLSREEMNNDG